MRTGRGLGTMALWLVAAMAGMGVGLAAERSEVTVCIGNPGSVDAVVVGVWQQELQRIVEAGGQALRVADCSEAGAVQVYFMRSHPTETSALGAARTRQARVLPLVEVYTEPVAALIGTKLPSMLGRAMARVTAHELTHYVRQELDHAEAGGFSGQYTAGLLLAARPGYFGMR